jgi:hypothetical protein
MAHARADNRYTRGLAEFVSGLGYDRIPQETIDTSHGATSGARPT